MSGTDPWPDDDRGRGGVWPSHTGRPDSAGSHAGWDGLDDRWDDQAPLRGGFGDEAFADEEFADEEPTGSDPDDVDLDADQDDNEQYPEGRGRFAAARGGRFGAERGAAGRFGLGARLAARRGPEGSSDDADEPGPAARPPRRMWRVLFIAAGVLAVAAVTYRTMNGSGDGGTPTGAVPTAKPVPADFLNSAATDVDPVTENEFFRDATVTIGTHTYTRIARKLDAGCPGLTGQVKNSLDRPAAPMPAATPSAVPSAAAAAAPPATAAPSATAAPTPAPTITGPACRQQIRALYLTEPDKGGRRLLAAVSVLVVDNAETAKQAAFILGLRQGGVTALPIPAGALPGAKITGPNGDNELRTAFPDGHYAVMIQLAYSDGSQAPKDDKLASDTATDLHSVAIQPLDERLLIGRGYHG